MRSQQSRGTSAELLLSAKTSVQTALTYSTRKPSVSHAPVRLTLWGYATNELVSQKHGTTTWKIHPKFVLGNTKRITVETEVHIFPPVPQAKLFYIEMDLGSALLLIISLVGLLLVYSIPTIVILFRTVARFSRT